MSYTLTINNTLSFDIELNEQQAPVSCHNFKQLVKKGFYNGLKVWYADPGYLFKTGCPNNDGTGHAGYKIHIEKEVRKVDKPFKLGSLGYCNSGKGSESCQFFVFLGDDDYHLNTCFVHFADIVTNQIFLSDIKKGDVIHIEKNSE